MAGLFCKWCDTLGLFLDEHSLCEKCVSSINKELKTISDKEEKSYAKIKKTKSLDVKIAEYKSLIDLYFKLEKFEDKGLLFTNKNSGDLVAAVYEDLYMAYTDEIEMLFADTLEKCEASTSVKKIVAKIEKASDRLIEIKNKAGFDSIKDYVNSVLLKLDYLKELYIIESILEEASKELRKESYKKAKICLEEALISLDKKRAKFYERDRIIELIDKCLTIVIKAEEDRSVSKENDEVFDLDSTSNWRTYIEDLKIAIVRGDEATDNTESLSCEEGLNEEVSDEETNYYKYDDGSICDDEQYEGYMQGKGKMNYSDGSVYEGDWKDGLKNGIGTMIYPDGSKYEGEWEDDMISGQGIKVLQDGSHYNGSWKNDMIHGKGILVLSTGDKYEGEFEKGLPHGQGKWSFANGDQYDGEFFKDKIHGKGTMFYIDGEKYEGNWENGLKQGFGTTYFTDGGKYEGEYKGNIECGRGKYTASDKSCYEGDFKNGARNGSGIMLISDGSKYEGEWLNDKMHGNGVFTLPDGAKQKGVWEKGQLLEDLSLEEGIDKKECPFCAEIIKAKAIKCRYCQTFLDEKADG